MLSLGSAFARALKIDFIQPPKICECETPSGPERSLLEYREELVGGRLAIVGHPGMYLDQSPTGSGKSTADIEVFRRINRGLIVTPTHKNCEEIEKAMLDADINAMAFPGRHTSGEGQNCWSELADKAESIGLSVVATVCPSCTERKTCQSLGYLAGLEAVKAADVAIATHARAIYNGLDRLAEGRGEFIAVHENAANTICPQAVASVGELQLAAKIIGRVLEDPKWLDWLGQSTSRKESGEWVSDDRLAEKRTSIYEFVLAMAKLIDDLLQKVRAAERTQAVEVKDAIPKATGVEYLLLKASLESKDLLPKETRGRFPPSLWRMLLAAQTGGLFSLGVVVTEDNKSKRNPQKEPAAETSKRKGLVGTWKNLPSMEAIVLFADATADHNDLEDWLGRPVKVITPEGRIAHAKRVVQYPIDFSRKASKKRFLNVVRGILSEFHEAQRVGIITLKPLVSALKSLPQRFTRRLSKIAYFGGGDDRASNEWHGNCDLILVIGTPRPDNEAVPRRLIQLRDFASAGEDGRWGDVHWRCRTESGAEVILKGRGYDHPAWDRAHRRLVRSALIQAIGRGRTLLQSGCGVIVVAAEEIGFPIADETDIELNETEADLIKLLSELSAEKSYRSFKAFSPMRSDSADDNSLTTSDLADRVKLSERQTREHLVRLESRGLVTRVGERGGWVLALRHSEDERGGITLTS